MTSFRSASECTAMDRRTRLRVWSLFCVLGVMGLGAEATAESMTSAEPLRVPFAPLVDVEVPRQAGPVDAVPRWLRRNPLTDASERDRVLIESLPQTGRDAELHEADRDARIGAALEAAATFEAAADHDGARYALERAIALHTDRAGVARSTWRALARARLRVGDREGATAALLAAFDTIPSPDTDPIGFIEISGRLHRGLAVVYALEGRERELAEAFGSAWSVAGREQAWLDWESEQRFGLSRPRFVPLTEPVVWPARPVTGVWADARAAIEGLIDELPWLARARALALEQGPQRLIAFGVGVIAIFVMLGLLRQRGDLTVAIEYPDELRGVFVVRITRSANRWRRIQPMTREAIRKGGLSSRSEHHLVNRETHFQRLRARRFRVMIAGMLFDPSTDEVLSDVDEELVVRVRHRRTVRLEFDVRPERCPVDVLLSWGDKPAEDAAVVAPDVAGSLVRSVGSRARLWLGKGAHRIVVGCGDRAIERDVDVASYRPTPVRVDLAGTDVLFKGCPPAVEPYLRGDIEETAKALERDGQAKRGYQLLAELHRGRGQLSRAADYYESSGLGLEAAKLRARLEDYERAATLFIENDEPLQAAEMYEQAGALVLAGSAYEEAHEVDRAIGCYREADEVDKWISALERRGRVFEAAQVALENGRRPRAIRLLQCIPAEDQDYAQASSQLADAFEIEGHFDLAAKKLEDYIATFPMGQGPADKYARLAMLFENAGHVERAISVLEELRRQEPTFPNVASRIDVLRKQLSDEGKGNSRTQTFMTDDAAPTEFVVESRYELTEEIGRGGMGVVFEARDRRLDRVVALKRLPEDLRRHHPRALQLFLREAQSLAKLNHPNIVTVHDTDQEDGAFFITMELLHGEPFNRILRERGRLSSENAIGIGRQVAAGLQYAHERGVIHRDIKTANLFLTTDLVVKIMDFGLAKVFEEMRGKTTVVSGTPYYMSPEQVLGADIDHRTDLYSLGVTLFELVTGRVPFDQGDVAYHHRHTPPPSPLEFVPDLDIELAHMIERLLEKDRVNRPASAQAVLDELRSFTL